MKDFSTHNVTIIQYFNHPLAIIILLTLWAYNAATLAILKLCIFIFWSYKFNFDEMEAIFSNWQLERELSHHLGLWHFTEKGT